MKSMIQSVFILMTLLLTGCNSEGAFNSAPVVVEITVTPSPILLLEGRTQQLVAMAKFDDGTESDVSGSVTWAIVGDPTIAEVSASGLVTVNTKGDIEITASKDGIISNTVTVNVCSTADICLDIFDTGSGKLFTNSPSVVYLDSIGGSATNGQYPEIGILGPEGFFYNFTLSQANALCDTYNTQSIGGRTNWRLATRDELRVELFDTYGEMYVARGWPISYAYWSATADGPNYHDVSLVSGIISSSTTSLTHYASCVSNP